MTQYRVFLTAILAAFILSACSGEKDDMKTETKAAETTAEQADSATTEDADKATMETQETTTTK